MELVSPIFDVGGRFWNCASAYARNVRDLERNLNSLEAAKEELVARKVDVMRRVARDERQRMKRTEQVDEWRRRVEEIEGEVDEILKEGRAATLKCLCGICPRNCWRTYKMSKKAKEKREDVTQQIEKGNFNEVAEMKLSSALDERPLERNVGLDQKFKEAWSCICDESTGMIIGIYGMGGVGKTTLLTKINNELTKSGRHFGEMIWVTVSKNSTLEEIQDEIGKKLRIVGAAWNTKNSEEKGTQIYGILNTKRFVLLLDNLWESLELSKIGIPQPSSDNKSKILFTTRNEEICGYMGAHKWIKINCLKWDDAWNLFQEKVGSEVLNSDPDIRKIAEGIARECDGLPLALSIVGRAMASRKTLDDWKVALRRLKSINFESVNEKVLPLLKFSYDNLSDETSRTCFQYYAVFPEDYVIHKSALVNLWMGEGFFDHCYSIYDAMDLGNEIVTRLRLACLLESGDLDDSTLKMHDLVRDMAVWIFSNSGLDKENLWVEKNLNLTDVPTFFRRWEKAQRISLFNYSIEELSGTPNCPRLVTLNLTWGEIKMISENFFSLMPSLKVLNLSFNESLGQLPESIGELVSLQHLDLSYTPLSKLPIGFKRLKRLQFLYMDGTSELEITPQEVISSLQMLRRLELCKYTPFGGEVERREVEGSILSGGHEMLLDELACLPELQEAKFEVISEKALRQFLNSSKLQEATSYLGIFTSNGMRSLPFSSLDKSTRLKEMVIGLCADLEELVSDDDFSFSRMVKSGCFDNLEQVTIENCRALQDLTLLISARNLKYLAVFYCYSMKEIIGEKIGMDSNGNENFHASAFPNLETLCLQNLPELTSICSHALPLPSLRRIIVFHCQKLQKLPFSTNSGMGQLNSIEGRQNWWNGLQWENEEIKLAFQPFFKAL